MTKLIIPPSAANYTVTSGNQVIRQQLDGGAGRYRQDIIGATSRVSVQWDVDRSGYSYLQSFYSTAGRVPSPFTIDLVVDDYTLTEYTAYFMPNSFRVSAIKGHKHTIVAELEVIPNQRDNTYNYTTVYMYNEYGDTQSMILSCLSELSNIQLPKHFR